MMRVKETVCRIAKTKAYGSNDLTEMVTRTIKAMLCFAINFFMWKVCFPARFPIQRIKQIVCQA